MTHYVISVGGGMSSTVFLPERIIAAHGKENVTLVMARLPNEDPDVWRLCDAVEVDYGVKINYIGLNQTPWDVFFHRRMLGSSRLDPCSETLKRKVLDRYMRENHDPADTVLCLGVTSDEIERMIHIRANWERRGWKVQAPLAESDFTMTREQQMAEVECRYGFVPRLYKWGFTHNNCSGACVKAGMREWARLLWYIPDVYAWWETNEQRFRDEIGPYSILRDRRGGTSTPLPLSEFRQRCEHWWQGCGADTLFEDLPRVKALDPTPACAYCAAA